MPPDTSKPAVLLQPTSRMPPAPLDSSLDEINISNKNNKGKSRTQRTPLFPINGNINSSSASDGSPLSTPKNESNHEAQQSQGSMLNISPASNNISSTISSKVQSTSLSLKRKPSQCYDSDSESTSSCDYVIGSRTASSNSSIFVTKFDAENRRRHKSSHNDVSCSSMPLKTIELNQNNCNNSYHHNEDGATTSSENYPCLKKYSEFSMSKHLALKLANPIFEEENYYSASECEADEQNTQLTTQLETTEILHNNDKIPEQQLFWCNQIPEHDDGYQLTFSSNNED